MDDGTYHLQVESKVFYFSKFDLLVELRPANTTPAGFRCHIIQLVVEKRTYFSRRCLNPPFLPSHLPILRAGCEKLGVLLWHTHSLTRTHAKTSACFFLFFQEVFGSLCLDCLLETFVFTTAAQAEIVCGLCVIVQPFHKKKQKTL